MHADGLSAQPRLALEQHNGLVSVILSKYIGAILVCLYQPWICHFLICDFAHFDHRHTVRVSAGGADSAIGGNIEIIHTIVISRDLQGGAPAVFQVEPK